MKKLENKIAVITGGSQGIGEAIAYHFADEGAEIIIVNRDKAKAEKVAKTIRAKNGKAHVRPFDLSQIDKIEGFVDELKQSFGRVDILVNNAGAAVYKSIEDSTLQDWQYTMDVNLTSVFFLTKAVAALMKGKIITGKLFLFHLSPIEEHS